MRMSIGAALAVGLVTTGALVACEKKPEPKPAPAVKPAPLVRPPSPSSAVARLVDGGTLTEKLEGRIAFIREREEMSEAMLLELADGGVSEVGVEEGNMFPASVSEDGLTLALLWSMGEDSAHLEQLHVTRLDARGRPRAIGPKSPRVRNPSFVPGGRELVFESGHASFSDVWAIDLSGKGLRRLTDNEEGNFEPSVAPDGKWVAFVSSRDRNPEIYRMSIDGSEETRLTTSAFEEVTPQVSPDGSHIAFLSNREEDDRLYVMRADGSQTRRLSPPADRGKPGVLTNTGEHTPVWSPDGRSIAFSRREADGTQGIWVVALSGEAKQLSSGDAHATPSWSPDGKYLAYSANEGGRAQLFAVSVATGAKLRLLESDAHDWRPVWFKR